ncbi:unnamed protein product [Chironomus riparius]|uniref:Uncharacterized protein n=1 Tax=Chironomus riparius TaxID=315576 RepID=A0A9N9RJ79_9DIPT|nr:unnamed protein product [Chironomus riparius]
MDEVDMMILYCSYGFFFIVTIFVFVRLYFKRRRNMIGEDLRNQTNIFTISSSPTTINTIDKPPSYEEVLKSQDPPTYYEVVSERNPQEDTRKY